ncbi:MAG: biopolymer transporter ExbD [Phycisphaerae bacterium]|nr:biopolymer transporter ExbD [Phycisphaerae bacterium]
MIDMTPMIDIVFQLLIFFLVTARMAQMSRADIDLPRERGEEASSKEQAGMTINVTASGEIVVSERTLTLDELESMAADLASSVDSTGGDSSHFRPLVRADASAPAQRLNAVLGALERAGVKGVRLGTSTDPSRKK